MIPEQKQAELQRHRTILLATLDYLEEHLGGSLVYDQYDPVTEYYQQQKSQTDKYYQQRRLDRLQQQLERLTSGLRGKVDLNFSGYIKEKTGYDIDIFKDLGIRVNAILAQNEIRSPKELKDIITMLHYFSKTSVNVEEIEKLKALLTSYSKRRLQTSHKRVPGSSGVISRVDKDDIVEITVRVSTAPKQLEEQVVISPDGKRRLRVVQWSDGQHPSTYVDVMFPTASGAIYGMRGIHSDVKAWWKDNSTIVIETRKEYNPHTRHQQVGSFEDVITIEYIER